MGKRFKGDFFDDPEKDCPPAECAALQGPEMDQKKHEAEGVRSDRQAAAAQV